MNPMLPIDSRSCFLLPPIRNNTFSSIMTNKYPLPLLAGWLGKFGDCTDPVDEITRQKEGSLHHDALAAGSFDALVVGSFYPGAHVYFLLAPYSTELTSRTMRPLHIYVP